MPKVEITGAKGVVQSTGSTMPLTLDTTNTVLKEAVVINSSAFVDNADSIVSWTQPANTIIDSISLLVTSAPTVAVHSDSDLGFEVGTSSSGAQIVATVADQIIDAAANTTPLAAGALLDLTVVRVATSETTLAVDASYTTSARSLYFNTTATGDSDVSVAGAVKWLVRYISFA